MAEKKKKKKKPFFHFLNIFVLNAFVLSITIKKETHRNFYLNLLNQFFKTYKDEFIALRLLKQIENSGQCVQCSKQKK